MKTEYRFERGQALILITFAIIGLIGITGLAVDGGIAFSDRRHAQNAADTAALAGALARINVFADPSLTQGATTTDYWKTMAGRMAEQNDYFNDIVNSQVEIYSCDELSAQCEAPYAGNPDYIQVIITSHVNTYFARALGIPQMTNRVQAIAKAKVDESGPLYNGDNIIALSHECQSPDNFIVEGTADIIVSGGGLYVNTDDPACGFKCDTSSGSITGDITTAGGTFDPSANCLANINGTIDEGGGELFDFPVYLEDLGLDVPPECDGLPLGTYSNHPAGTTIAGISTYPGFPTQPVTILYPGYYSEFPPAKEQPLGKLNDIILMQPGTYCVATVLRWNQPNFVLMGHDVTMFIRGGYYFSLTGGTMQLDAPDSGPYAGYLMIVEPNYGDPPLSENPENCVIDGTAQNTFTGTIFAPYCNVTINGGSEPTGFNAQVIGYTIKINGSATVDFTYNAGEQGTRISPPKVGLSH